MTSRLNIIWLALIVQCLPHEVDGCALQRTEGQNAFKASEVKAWLSCVSIDKGNMIQHIRMVRKIFEQNYAFYYTAADPLASTPSNHQPELGYTLYNTTQAGKVNLASALAHLEEDVSLHGANFTTFWALAKPFYQLYDGHVALPGATDYFGELKSMQGLNTIVVFSEKGHGRYANFSYQDGEMKLDMRFEEGVSKTVTKLNGQTPYEFILSLANAPVEGLRKKALGARVNALLATDGGWSGFTTDAKPLFLQLRTLADPEGLLPDEFTVEYGDGSYELFLTRVKLDTTNLDVEQMKNEANRPGHLYDTWQQAVGKATSRRLQRAPPKASPAGRALTKTLPCPMVHGGFTVLDWATQCDGLWGYKIIETERSDDSYAVVKIDDFMGNVNPVKFAKGWMQVVNASKKRGIKKLIVDISNNGGGSVPLGYTLAQCMFPDVPFENISNFYDMPFNEPMKIFAHRVLPWLETVSARDLSVGAELFSTEDKEKLFKVVDAIANLDGEGAFNLDVESFDTKSLENVLEILKDTFTRKNPWTVAWGFSPYDVHNDDLDHPYDVQALEAVPVERYLRGGVEANFTSKFRMPTYSESIYSQVRDICSQHFTEYLVLGNGLSGSTCNTFQTTVSQLAANAVSGSGATLRGVTYGGTKDPFETPLTQFAGGSVSSPQISNPYVSLGGLYLIKILQQIHAKSTTTLDQLLDDLVAAIPETPYFWNSWPGMPVVEVYNNYMGPGAMPLEYVHMPPDFHIPQIFAKTSFTDDLSELYERASRYFASASSTTTATGSWAVSSSAASFPTAVSYVLMFLLCWL